jgi:hydrogenase nickel incorporation protein HypB
MTTRIVELRRGILKKNDELAAGLRERFTAAGVLVLNLVSSPGTGKTAFLQRTLIELRARGARVAALVGDLETDNDAQRLAASGAPVRQINTHGICHLDAEMIDKHLADWEGVELGRLDFLFIENVGNLVCPSSYDLGERVRVALLSVTEGEDKPLKYPTMFNSADAAVITKMDLAEPCSFDRELALKNIREIRPGIQIFETSAKTGEGMKAWLNYLALEGGGRGARLDGETVAVPQPIPIRRETAPSPQPVEATPEPEEVFAEPELAPSGEGFTSVREAKEYLVGLIDDEARRSGHPLMEVERKMLYDSAKGWTLREIDQVRETFNLYHDPVEYEEKISGLIRSVRQRARAGKDRQFEAWTEAVHALGREKHYLLDLIAAAGETPRLRGRRLKLWLVLLVCAVLAGVAIWMGLHPDEIKVYVPNTH